MQKYRADRSETQKDGAILWYADWMDEPNLSRIDDCRLVNMEGDMRRTVYITGEADTYFSIPAVCPLERAPDKGVCDKRRRWHARFPALLLLAFRITPLRKGAPSGAFSLGIIYISPLTMARESSTLRV